MNIAPLRNDRIPAAVALWASTGLTRPWNDATADVTRALAGPASTVLAAMEGDALVGTVMVGHDGHRGWVYYLAVDPAFRGAGRGRRLMAAAESWLVQRGTVKVNLMVRAGNTAAAGFYQHLGYAAEAVTVFSRRL